MKALTERTLKRPHSLVTMPIKRIEESGAGKWRHLRARINGVPPAYLTSTNTGRSLVCSRARPVVWKGSVMIWWCDPGMISARVMRWAAHSQRLFVLPHNGQCRSGRLLKRSEITFLKFGVKECSTLSGGCGGPFGKPKNFSSFCANESCVCAFLEWNSFAEYSESITSRFSVNNRRVFVVRLHVYFYLYTQ